MRWIFLILPVLACGLAFGEAPATQPATRPTDAVKRFYNATWEGLPDEIAANCTASTPEIKQIIGDMCDMAKSIGALREAGRAKFGNAGYEAAAPLILPPDEVDGGTELVDGDHAVVHFKGGPPVPALLVDGIWKVDVAGELQRGGTTPEIAHRIFSALTAGFAKVADDTRAGKFADAPAMRSAMIDAQQNAMKQIAATAPSPK